MTLARNIADLAEATAREIKARAPTDHPGLARAWVCFAVAHSQVVIRAAFNIARVTRLAKGTYRVEFAEPMPDSHYCWQAFARSGRRGSSLKHATASAHRDVKCRCSVDVICTTRSGKRTDTAELNLTVFR